MKRLVVRRIIGASKGGDRRRPEPGRARTRTRAGASNARLNATGRPSRAGPFDLLRGGAAYLPPGVTATVPLVKPSPFGSSVMLARASSTMSVV